MHSGKLLGMRTIGKNGDHYPVMALGGEMHFHGALLYASLQEGKAAGIVVCSHYDKGVAVLFCPPQDGAYHLVEIKEFFTLAPSKYCVGQESVVLV